MPSTVEKRGNIVYEVVDPERHQELAAYMPVNPGETVRYFSWLGPKLTRWDYVGIGGYSRRLAEVDKSALGEVNEIILKELERMGLWGIHEVIAQPNIKRGSWGNIRGDSYYNSCLFFAHGESHLRGDFRTVSSMQYVWSPNGEDILITEVPFDKVRFRTRNRLLVPQVSLGFNVQELRTKKSWNEDQFLGRPIRSIGVRRLPRLNDYLTPDMITEAIVFIPEGSPPPFGDRPLLPAA